MPLLWSRARHNDSGPTLPPPPLPGPSPAARAAALPESLPPPLPGPSPAARAAALLTETRRRAAAQNGTARLDEGVVQTQKAGAGWRSSTAHIEVKGEAVGGIKVGVITLMDEAPECCFHCGARDCSGRLDPNTGELTCCECWALLQEVAILKIEAGVCERGAQFNEHYITEPGPWQERCEDCGRCDANGRVDAGDGNFYCTACWSDMTDSGCPLPLIDQPADNLHDDGGHPPNGAGAYVSVCNECGDVDMGEVDDSDSMFYCHKCWADIDLKGVVPPPDVGNVVACPETGSSSTRTLSSDRPPPLPGPSPAARAAALRAAPQAIKPACNAHVGINSSPATANLQVSAFSQHFTAQPLADRRKDAQWQTIKTTWHEGGEEEEEEEETVHEAAHVATAVASEDSSTSCRQRLPVRQLVRHRAAQALKMQGGGGSASIDPEADDFWPGLPDAQPNLAGIPCAIESAHNVPDVHRPSGAHPAADDRQVERARVLEWKQWEQDRRERDVKMVEEERRAEERQRVREKEEWCQQEQQLLAHASSQGQAADQLIAGAGSVALSETELWMKETAKLREQAVQDTRHAVLEEMLLQKQQNVAVQPANTAGVRPMKALQAPFKGLVRVFVGRSGERKQGPAMQGQTIEGSSGSHGASGQALHGNDTARALSKDEALQSHRAKRRQYADAAGGVENQPLSADEKTRMWTEEVLPAFDTHLRKKWVHALWRSGIPYALRRRVWPLAIGNRLNLIREDYCRTLERVQQASVCVKNAELIAGDLPRTRLRECVSSEAKRQTLGQLLLAVAAVRPLQGYVQGMSFVGAFLLECMEADEAFVCFANLLGLRYFPDFLAMRVDRIEARYTVFGSLLRQERPRLAAHFSSIGFSAGLVMTDWWLTIFSRQFSPDIVGRIWDCFLLEGEPMLFRVGLALCSCLEPRLMEQPLEVCLSLISQAGDELTETALFDAIGQVSASVKSIRVLLEDKEREADFLEKERNHSPRQHP